MPCAQPVQQYSPAMTAHTVRYLATLKGMPLADFCARLQDTGTRVFRW